MYTWSGQGCSRSRKETHTFISPAPPGGPQKFSSLERTNNQWGLTENFQKGPICTHVDLFSPCWWQAHMEVASCSLFGFLWWYLTEVQLVRKLHSCGGFQNVSCLLGCSRHLNTHPGAQHCCLSFEHVQNIYARTFFLKVCSVI